MTIYVLTLFGVQAVPVLERIGEFAVHHEAIAGGLNPNGFCVTHVPSGYKVPLLREGFLESTFIKQAYASQFAAMLNHALKPGDIYQDAEGWHGTKWLRRTIKEALLVMEYNDGDSKPA